MPRPRNQLTAGEWAILALLDEEPAHGFALARAMATGGEVGRGWDMRPPLVYVALETPPRRALVAVAQAAVPQPPRRGSRAAAARPARAVRRAGPAAQRRCRRRRGLR